MEETRGKEERQRDGNKTLITMVLCQSREHTAKRQ